jgi:hypothetical protein
MALQAQQPSDTGATLQPPSLESASAPDADNPKPRSIQDNSFLLEEAYNQEFGVVQHISSFTRFWDSKDWVYTFTQEWPVPGNPKHQLSFTLPVSSVGDSPGSGAGIGDVMFNYRYQLIGNNESRIAFAPRLSALFPSGDPSTGRGTGGYGVQASLPLSVVLSQKIVSHWNIGTTIVPSARNAFGQSATTAAYNLGQSFIWLAHPRFNVLLETVWSGTEDVVGQGKTQRSHDLLLSPGIRWAYNFKNGLQIVPGIATPQGLGPSSGEHGVLLYLSFEHPFRKLQKK